MDERKQDIVEFREMINNLTNKGIRMSDEEVLQINIMRKRRDDKYVITYLQSLVDYKRRKL